MIKRLLKVILTILLVPAFAVSVLFAFVTLPIFYIITGNPGYIFDKIDDIVFKVYEKIFK